MVPAANIPPLISKAAAILREEGATDVFFFGSAAEGTLTPASDLDLAVRGLPPERYFHTVGRLLAELRCPVDLLNVEDDSPLVRLLLERGKLRHVA